MLLPLSHPLTSLPNTLNLLEKYGNTSGKLNLQKWEIMAVKAVAKEISFSLFPLKVSTQKLKNLGIWITPVFKDIFKANVSPLLNHLKQVLECWNLRSLPLFGRNNIIKMNVLPKFLYIFQCIPLYFNKIFLIFVTGQNNKNPWIWRRILQQHCQHGGSSQPHLQFCYWAANIRSMLFWKDCLSGIAVPEWLRMEDSSCIHTYSLHSLLCSKVSFGVYIKIHLYKLKKCVYLGSRPNK